MSKNQTLLILGAGCLIVLCAALGLTIGIAYLVPELLAPNSTIAPADSNPRPNANANSMGDPDAPIRMVEFGDFQCPFCERFHVETEPALVQNYIATGKVHFTYRSMGNFISQNAGNRNTESQDAAQAAYCAADQNKFWEMHDSLFVNNRDVENQGAFAPRNLLDIAESIGLDDSEFQNCFDGGKYAEQTQQDLDDALGLGIQGTPTFILTYEANGETQTAFIEGAQPYSDFQQILDQILAEIGK
ncbi:MAG: thioredoxin domain-containing protein [Anaerolineales bacterium]|nr:thioredoxin domain-containing protein [Anaerolineales bacterium]